MSKKCLYSAQGTIVCDSNKIPSMDIRDQVVSVPVPQTPSFNMQSELLVEENIEDSFMEQYSNLNEAFSTKTSIDRLFPAIPGLN